MRQKIWNRKNFIRLSYWITHHTHLFIFFAVFLTGLSLYGVSNLKIDSDYMAFLPDSFPGVTSLKRVIEKTGGFGNFMIVLEGATPEIRRHYATQLAPHIEKLTWVDSMEIRKNFEAIEKNKLLFVKLQDLSQIHDRIKRAIAFKKNPMLISLFEEGEKAIDKLDFSDIERKYQKTGFGTDYFEDPNLKYTIAIVWPKGSMTQMDFVRQTYRDLQSVLDHTAAINFHPQLKATIGGEFRNKVDEYLSLKKDVVSSAILTFMGIFLVTYLFFRRKRAVASILVPLLLGTVWTMGLAWLVVGRLNLLTVFLVAMLLGLGLDYGIYFYSRYIEERKKAKVDIAITEVLFHTGRSSLSSAAPIALSFFLLMLTDFKGFQEFGLLAGLGIIIIFCTFFIYSPVIWVLSDRPQGDVYSPPDLLTKAYTSKFILMGFILLAGIGCWGILHMHFERDYGKLRSKKNTYWETASKIHEVFPLSKTPAVVITDTLEEAAGVAEEVFRRSEKTDTIDTVKSILDFLPDQIEQKKEVLQRIESLILKNKNYLAKEDKERLDDFLPYLRPEYTSLDHLPVGLLRQFTGLPDSKGYMVFIYDKVRLSDATLAKKYADDIRAIQVGNKTFYPAEGSLLFAEALDQMINQSAQAFGLMIVAIYLLLIWDFRSPLVAGKVLLPVLISVLVTFGILYFMGIKINLFNLVIFPILLGVGIDGSIHIYHRLEGSSRPDLDNAVACMATALTITTINNIIGFGSTIISDHRGLSSLGWVATIGILVHLVTTLIFFPNFLYHIRKKNG